MKNKIITSLMIIVLLVSFYACGKMDSFEGTFSCDLLFGELFSIQFNKDNTFVFASDLREPVSFSGRYTVVEDNKILFITENDIYDFMITQLNSMDLKYDSKKNLLYGNYDGTNIVFTSVSNKIDTSGRGVVAEGNAEKSDEIKVGDICTFGSYEQDNYTSNGKEDIEWIVLAKEEDKVLVISKYALDCQQYNTSYTNVTWEKCSLRTWLNDTFLNEAFSAEEQAQIQMTIVPAGTNPRYNTVPANATKDKVFLLSISEVEEYFADDNAQRCKCTQYANDNGADVNSKNYNCMWWLRSPGDTKDSAAFVYSFGAVAYQGDGATNYYYSVRPAMWISDDFCLEASDPQTSGHRKGKYTFVDFETAYSYLGRTVDETIVDLGSYLATDPNCLFFDCCPFKFEYSSKDGVWTDYPWESSDIIAGIRIDEKGVDFFCGLQCGDSIESALSKLTSAGYVDIKSYYNLVFFVTIDSYRYCQCAVKDGKIDWMRCCYEQ